MAGRTPSRLLLGLEAPRAAAEYAWFAASWPAVAFAPRGDGHGVLVLPGWLTGVVVDRLAREVPSWSR